MCLFCDYLTAETRFLQNIKQNSKEMSPIILFTQSIIIGVLSLKLI